MKKSMLPWHLLTVAALLVPTLYLAYAWPQLPTQIPTHFGSSGINGYTAREDIWLETTALPLGVFLLMAALPRLDPRKKLAAHTTNLVKLRLVLVGMVSGLAVYSLYLALHPGTVPGRGLNVLIGLGLALLGNYLTTVQPNYFVGIRTPWALENDAVWAQTHRLGGRLFFGVGLLLAAVGGLAPADWFAPAVLTLVLLATAGTYYFSYRAYRQLQTTTKTTSQP